MDDTNTNVLHDSANAEKLLKMTTDTLILLKNDGICVDLIVKTENPYINEKKHLIGKNILRFFPKETIEYLKPELERVIATGEMSNKNYDLPSENRMYYFKCIIYKYDDEHILLQYRDITQRSQMKKRLEVANIRLEEVERAAKIGHWSYNTHSRIVEYSGYTGAIFSKDGEKSSISIDEILSYLHPDDRASFMTNASQADITGHVWEYRIINKKTAYVRLKIVNERIENGVRIVEGYTQNVSDLIERRNELEMVMSVVNHSTESIYACKMDGTLIFANQLCRKQNGISIDADITKLKAHQMLKNIHSQDLWNQFAKDIIFNNNILKYTCTQPYPAYNIIASDCISYVIKNGIGEDIVWSFRRDISDQLRYEEELMHAKELAEESDRLKSAFISNMSHEIRTPLNAIVGFSGIIAQTNDEKERKEYYKIVESNSNQLLHLVNEVLELSRMESGRGVDFEKTAINLNDLCSELQTSHQLCCTTAHLFFDKPDYDYDLITDRRRLMQVLSNLIVNAIKFTPKGSIHFGYILLDKSVEFYVRDTGIGIPEQQLGKVFDRFVKLNDFAPGSGLGLSICRAIVEKLGGQIGVESILGEGTTFRFTVPI